MNNEINAAIYIRISTDTEEQEKSLFYQKEICKEIIEENGWKLYDIYVDKVSGRVRKRPQFKKLEKEMEDGKVQRVLVKEGSRLARNVSTFENLRELATRKNIHFLSADGDLDTFNKGYQCITRVGADAQGESEKTSLRVKNTNKVMAKRGEFIGSYPAYGYRSEDKKLYPKGDGTEKVVKKIFLSYLEGKGADTIAKELTELSIPTPSMVIRKKNATSIWSESTITDMLRREVYVGHLVQCVEETYIAKEERKRRKKTEETYIRVENTHKPIISKEIFDGVQRLLTSRGKKAGKKGQKHLFTNLLFCKDCGCSLTYSGSWSKGSYICSNYKKKKLNIKCTNHKVQETFLFSKIKKDMSQFNQLQLERYIKKAEQRLERAILRLEGRINPLKQDEADIKRRISIIEDEIIDSHGQKEKQAKLERRLENQEEKLKSKETEILQIQENISHLSGNKVREEIRDEVVAVFNLNKMDLKYLNLLIKRIDVHEDKSLDIHYHFEEPIPQNPLSS